MILDYLGGPNATATSSEVQEGTEQVRAGGKAPMEEQSVGCSAAGFANGRRAKERGRLLEAGPGQQTDFLPVASPEESAACQHLGVSPVRPQLDF